MSVARKWVFPILRLVLVAAIAAALVKIAFFPDRAPEDAAAAPSVELVEPQVAVSVGTVRNDVTVQGTISADAPAPVKATLAGEVREVLVQAGATVEADTALLRIRAETPNPDGTMATKWSTVTAGGRGVLAAFDVLVGQVVAVGDEVGKVAPPSFSVSGPLTAEQQYRLLSIPGEATVTIKGGPAPFTCPNLRISNGTATGGTPDPLTGDSGGGGGTTVTCSVPAEVRAFAGLPADITIAGGLAENVLVLPTTAVEGAADTGNVHVVLEDGSTEVRPVKLGLNDGTLVEIKEGLAEGDQILEFVPGAPSEQLGPDGLPLPEGCFDDGMGGIICEEG